MLAQQAARPSRVNRQLRTYLHRVTWIVVDLVRQFPIHVLAITALHMVSVAAGAATIGLLILFVHHVAGGEAATIGPWTVPRINGMMAGAIGGFISALGLFSACCVYLAETGIVRLAVKYQRECERRLFRIAGDPAARGWAALLDGPAVRQLEELRSRGCRSIALNARWLMRGVLPMFILIVALPALIAADWLLTVMLMPLGIAYTVPLYYVNRGAATAQRRYRQEHRPASKAVSRALQRVVAGGTDHSEPDASVLDTPSYFEAGMLFFKRRLLVEQDKLLNMILFVTATAVLFVYAAVQAGSPEWSWSRLLLYIVALRFTVGGLQQVTSMFVRLSRFFPEYRPYIDFIDNVADRRRSRATSGGQPGIAGSELSIGCGNPTLPDAPSRVIVPRPGPLWVVLPWRPARADLEAVAVRLEQRARGVTGLLAVSRFDVDDRADSPTSAPLADLDDADLDHVRECFTQLGVLDELEPWLQWRTSEHMPDLDSLSRDARWALTSADLFGPCQIVFPATPRLRRLSARMIERLAALFSDRYVVLVTDNLKDALESSMANWTPDTARVLVFASRKPLGGGTLEWLSMHAVEVTEALVANGGQAGPVTDASEHDECDQ